MVRGFVLPLLLAVPLAAGDRAETPEQMLEPLLNGNEIMSETKLSPGPQVGVIRDALLKAQIAGEVTDLDSAVLFVRDYARKSVG